MMGARERDLCPWIVTCISSAWWGRVVRLDG